MGPYLLRNSPYPGPGGRFFFGAPFVGGLLGGFIGSAIFRPRPYPYYPYGAYPPYGYPSAGYPPGGYPPYGGGGYPY
jgi:hypothetical protein